MHVIHWKKQAINDVIRIGQDIAKDSPASARKMIDLIEGKVTPFAGHPNLGLPGRKRGTHELIAHESYVMIYRVLAKKIEILRVKHTAQQWPHFLSASATDADLTQLYDLSISGIGAPPFSA